MDYIFIVAIYSLNIAVLYHIVTSRDSRFIKVLYSLLVFLIPIIGIAIYYLIKYYLNKNKRPLS